MDSRLTKDYLTIPTRLITEMRDNVLALALYCLVARLYLIAQTPVPLSRADILRYDPSLKTGAVKRALDRLVVEGWLFEESGHKNRYIPTWGRSRSGAPRSWRIGADYLGCPRHVFTVRLDRGILDIYMGKLTPHARNTAAVERWHTTPLIGLRDVGAYLLALVGLQVTSTKTLLRWSLIRDGHAQPIPDDDDILKLVSQRQLEDPNAPQLKPAGWQKLGLPIACPLQQGQDEGQGENWQPLFFAPKELIGHLIPQMIGHPIGCSTESETTSSAPESAEKDTRTHIANIRGNLGISRETRDTPPPSPQPRQNSGSGDQQHYKNKNRERPAPPETESTRLLRSIHAFPSSIAELADMPAELVGRAIAYAQAEPGIERIPGWVVEALRRHRDEGWPIPAPRTRQIGLTSRDRPIDVEHYTSGAYGDLFRRGSDTSGLDDSSVDWEDGPFGAPSASAMAPAPEASAVQPEPFAETDAASAEASTPADLPRSESADEALTRQVQAELMLRCGRQWGRVIAGLRGHVAAGATLLICATVDDMAIVQHELIGAIQCILVRLGAPPQLVFTTRGGWEARRGAGGNVPRRPAATRGVPSTSRGG